MNRLGVNWLDPAGASDGQVTTYDAVAGKVVWADGGTSGGVQSIIPGTGIVVDSTDPAKPVVSATGGGGGSAETFAQALIAALGSAIVHDWNFDETSGATVADSVGTLDLTLNGTYTRNVNSLTGKCTSFISNAYAVSSGLGNVPVGAAERCLIAVYRTAVIDLAEQTIYAYGVESTRQWFAGIVNHASTGNRPNLLGSILGNTGTDNNPLTNVPSNDGEWSMMAVGVNSEGYVHTYLNGLMRSAPSSGAINTSSASNFYVGQRTSGSNRFTGDIDRVIVCNAMPSKRALDRIYRALL